MKTKKNKTVYGNAVNLSGLYSKRPLACRYSVEDDCWWDKSGDFDVQRLGESDNYGNISYSSASKSEVEAWTKGVIAAMTLLKRWTDHR